MYNDLRGITARIREDSPIKESLSVFKLGFDGFDRSTGSKEGKNMISGLGQIRKALAD